MNKIIVTGAFGFIGSHLVEYLIEQNYQVVAFDRYNSYNDWGWLQNSNYKNEIEFILGDIRDYDSVNNLTKRGSSIIHLAALIGIPYSYVSPLAYLKTNIEGTYNILEAAKNNNIEQTIITSTSEVYGTAKYTPIDEKHVLSPQSPYSASKIACDNLALSYFNSFNLPVKIIRPFNNYGPRQSERAIIPTIISQLLNNKSKKLNLGNITPTRDFTYVIDTCRAYEQILKNNNFIGDTTNVGTNNEISIGDLALKISKIMKIDVKISTENIRLRPENSEVERLVCDNSKILKLSKWSPDFSIDEGLIKTIKWFKENQSHLKPEFFNV